MSILIGISVKILVKIPSLLITEIHFGYVKPERGREREFNGRFWVIGHKIERKAMEPRLRKYRNPDSSMHLQRRNP